MRRKWTLKSGQTELTEASGWRVPEYPPTVLDALKWYRDVLARLFVSKVPPIMKSDHRKRKHKQKITIVDLIGANPATRVEIYTKIAIMLDPTNPKKVRVDVEIQDKTYMEKSYSANTKADDMAEDVRKVTRKYSRNLGR